MTLWLIISVCTSCGLAVALGIVFLLTRKYRRPYDPLVSLYVQKKAVHGWVVDGYRGLSVRPADAMVARLSSVRGLANELVLKGYYVRVVRVVHPEHWKEGYRGGK